MLLGSQSKMFQKGYQSGRYILFSVMLLLIACQSEPAPWQTVNITGYRPNLAFTLTDANHDKSVEAEDFLGRLVILSFGFTHCPDVCPMSLHQLQSALALLNDQANQVQILFVSVDPERDSTDVLKQYTENFGSNVIGLRGADQAVNKLAQMYKISYGAEEPMTNGQYDVYHSQAVYVFDRKGIARLLIRPDDKVEAIANDLRRLLVEKV